MKGKESSCKNWGYHDFEVIVDKPDIMVEQCTKCGVKKRFNKIGKSIDDKKYMSGHARDALQPFDKRGEFKKEYGRES